MTKFFCLECANIGGEGKPCKFCGKKKKVSQQEKNLIEIKRASEKEHRATLKKWFKQLKTFNLDTTGSPEVDEEIREMFGDWK